MAPAKSPSDSAAPKGKAPPRREALAPKPQLWVRIVKWCLLLGLTAIALGSAAIAFTFWMYGRDPKLPQISKLSDYQYKKVTTILDSSDRRIGELGSERRTVVPYEKIPEIVVDAFVAAEDNHFWTHGGVDYVGMIRAFKDNLVSGRTKEGASTITQQVVKNMLLTNERTFKRKIQEIILARRLESTLSKQEIMALYLNKIYFGHNRYGVEEAARYYFGKDISQVNVGEAALLASLPKNPNGLSRRDPEAFARVKARQEYVLHQMVAIGKLSQADEQKWDNEPIKFVDKPFESMTSGIAPEWVDMIHEQLLRDALGSNANLADKEVRADGEAKLDTLGHEVRTTLDLGMQRIARNALQDGLRAVDKRQGIARPIRQLKGDKIDLEIAKLAKKLPADGPKPKEVYEAVVTGVFDGDHEMLVDLGNYSAAVLLDSKEDERYNPPGDDGKRKLPSERFAIGDVVKVVAASGAVAVDDKDKGEEEENAAGSAAAAAAIAAHEEAEAEANGNAEPAPAPVPAKSAAKPPAAPAVRKPVHGNRRVAFAPGPEGAVVVMEVKTRKVRALVGGYESAIGGFDRATMAHRQPGSSFKPIVYAAAMIDAEQRANKPRDSNKTLYTPGTIVNDAPQALQTDANAAAWKPKNYETGTFEGKVRLRTALAKSINEVSAQIAADIGPAAIVDLAHKLGIKSELPTTLSLALGAGEVTPLELINAEATFAAGGFTAPPRFVEAMDGKPTEPEPGAQVVSAQVSFLMLSMMQSVVTEGTGIKAAALKIPIAGKTGTANEEKNTWFVGLTPTYAIVVWVGYDDPRPMPHEQGGVTSVPVYVDIMKQLNQPATPFAKPADGIVEVTIDKATGLLANPDAPKSTTMSEVFLKGTEPTETAPLPDEKTERSVVDGFD